MIRLGGLRPTHPIAADYVLGFCLFVWGMYALTWSALADLKSYHWLTGSPVKAIALAAAAIGVAQGLCAARDWLVASKLASFCAMGLFLNLGVQTWTASSHGPVSAIYLALAISNFAVVLADGA